MYTYALSKLFACVESKFYGTFVLNHHVVLHAIDVHPTHWLISTQL